MPFQKKVGSQIETAPLPTEINLLALKERERHENAVRARVLLNRYSQRNRCGHCAAPRWCRSGSSDRDGLCACCRSGIDARSAAGAKPQRRSDSQREQCAQAPEGGNSRNPLAREEQEESGKRAWNQEASETDIRLLRRVRANHRG